MSKKKIQKFSNYNLKVSYEGREGLVYCRVSSKRQETEGSGLTSQEGRCISKLKDLNVPYVKTFPDSYSGGGDFMHRPEMRAMLEYIDNHPHKKFVVIFDDLARFARDVFFHLKLRAEFRKRDVALKCLNYDFDESEEGEYIELIFAGKAQLDRTQNRRQVIQKQKARLELGYWAFPAKKPYKMDKDPMHGKIPKPRYPQAQWLKEAMEGFATGKFIRKIDACKFLVEKGYWSKQKPERYIDKITELFEDVFFAGYVEYPEWEVTRRKGFHEGIISLETHEMIQKRLGKLDFGKRIRVDLSEDFPSRGLLICAECGKHITGAWSKGKNKKHPYYFCQNKECIYHNKSIRRSYIDDGLDDLLKKSKLKKNVSGLVGLVFDDVWKERINNFDSKQKNNLSKKNELENKIKNITDLILSSRIDSVKIAYENQIESISKELEDIQDNNLFTNELDMKIPYRTALDKVNGLLKSPYSVWVNLSLKEKHDMFFFIFREKLAYSIKDGYRTDKIPTAIRLFEEFTTVNSHDVVKSYPLHEPILKRMKANLTLDFCIFSNISTTLY